MDVDPTLEEIEQKLQEFIGGKSRVVATGDRETSILPGNAVVCDFCYDEPAPYVYNAREIAFDAVTIGTYTIDNKSSGNWAACGTCAAMIDTNDRAALLARSVKRFHSLHPDVPVEYLKISVGRSQRAFFKARRR